MTEATTAAQECDGRADRPSDADMTLLRQWGAFQAGFKALNDDLLTDVEKRAGISPSSFEVLWYLLGADGNTAKMYQLAETLGFSTAGTTKVADRLVDAGLIDRRPSPDDRRVILAELTPEGRRVGSEAAFALIGALRERVVGKIGTEKFAEIATLIGDFGPEFKHC